MSSTDLKQAVEQYSAALVEIEQARPSPSARQTLAALKARDLVQAALADKAQDPVDSLLTLVQLDDRLRKQAGPIAQSVNLTEWRASLNPPAQAWWWFLEAHVPPHRSDRFDWLWSATAVLCLTGSLSLLVDISSRFLKGGPDTFGAFAVIVQSTLTLLAAGGALTKAGQEVIERALKSLNAPKHFWNEIKLGLAVALLLGLVSFHLSLPQIAILYNNNGLENYRAGHLASAQFDYDRALKLNPDYPEAHYNLGLLYEDLQDPDRARTEYQLALSGGLDAAYNNSARLYILEENYSAAVQLLLVGLDSAQDDTVRYDMLKNLGWARLGQGRYAEAKASLEPAIALASEKAAAYCLLAQVLEAQDDQARALVEWENCLKFADGRNPDEDAWIDLARRALTEGGQ